MLLRIAEKLRAISAVPGEFAGIARHRRQTLIDADRDAEAETEAAEMWLDLGGVVLGLGAEMIRCHELNRLRAEDALPVEFTAVEQHLAEADVVADGGKRA